MSGSYHSFYLSSGLRANAFLPWGFGDASHRARRVALAASRKIPDEVLASLRTQNAAFRPTAARKAHLQAAGEPGSTFVVTGQQVGLFLGPLYTFYKAATAVVVARTLAQETGSPCIPVFWLQTEDHDFDEIAHCELAIDLEPPFRLELPSAEGSRRSVSGLTLPPEIDAVVDKLKQVVEGRPFGKEVVELLNRHYRRGALLATAFAGVLAELFEEEGLLVFDPRQEGTARLGGPVFQKAISEARRIETVLRERGKALAAAGYSEQVPLREAASLAFFHQGSAAGPRYRLGRREDAWELLGADATVTDSEIRTALDREPLRFSTSALLRPILQDVLLPTAAYVGGPAEVDYFAQMTALYPLFDLEAPLLVPRSRFLLVPPRIRLLLKRLQLEAADFAQPLDQVKRRVAAREFAIPGSHPGPAWSQEIDRRLSEFVKGPDVDPGLVRAAERTRQSVHRALDRLGRRYERASMERQKMVSSRVERIAGWLQPRGQPQERLYNFSTFAARIGPKLLREKIVGAVNVFDPALREIDL